MGEFVRYISDISPGYDTYLLVLANDFGNYAERVIYENFERMADVIGERAVISKLFGDEGIRQAEQKFGVKVTDKRPILILTDVHPNDWTKMNTAIKVQLGNFGNENDIRDLLFRMSTWIRSGEWEKVRWDQRKKTIKEIVGKLPVVDIIGTVVGFPK